jgi:hypothetical protein
MKQPRFSLELRNQIAELLGVPAFYVNDEMIRLLGHLANGWTWNDEYERKVRMLANEIGNEISATRFIQGLQDKLAMYQDTAA